MRKAIPRSDKIIALYTLVGETMARKLCVSRQGKGEFLAADVYLRPYYFIDGDFDFAAYERTIKSAKRRGFATDAVFVIATGFETYQDTKRIRFHRAYNLASGGAR